MLRQIRSVRPFAFAIAAALVLAACSQGTKLQPTATGEKSEIEKNFSLLTDIPIPPNATLDVERSLVLGDLDRWTGRIILNVGQSTTAAFALYQPQMPNFGWDPIMSVQTSVSVLSFVRGERAATVQIESRTLGGSTVAVTVAPRQSGPPPGTGSSAPVQVTPQR